MPTAAPTFCASLEVMVSGQPMTDEDYKLKGKKITCTNIAGCQDK